MSLQSQLNSFVLRVAEKFDGIEERAGSLDQLSTVAKSNLVVAINELAARESGGSSTGIAYTHVQLVAEAIWTVNHNLGMRPAVTILDSGGTEVEADVMHMSTNQLVIRFAIPLAGVARLT